MQGRELVIPNKAEILGKGRVTSAHVNSYCGRETPMVPVAAEGGLGKATWELLGCRLRLGCTQCGESFTLHRGHPGGRQARESAQDTFSETQPILEQERLGDMRLPIRLIPHFLIQKLGGIKFCAFHSLILITDWNHAPEKSQTEVCLKPHCMFIPHFVFCSPVHRLMDVWAVSSFWLLWIMLLWVLVCMFLFEYLFLIVRCIYLRRMKCQYMPLHEWNLETLCWVKEPRWKGSHIIWFHLCEMTKRVKSTETKSRGVVSRAVVLGNGEWLGIGTECLFRMKGMLWN